MLQPSQNYINVLLPKFESIAGEISPGIYGYYFDDIGVATIGFGHALIDANENHIIRGQNNYIERAQEAVQALGNGNCLSMAQVLDLKMKDISAFSIPVSALVRPDTSQYQFDAMVDFSYNLGLGAFRSSTLLRMHNGYGPTGEPSPLNTYATFSKLDSPIANIGEAFGAWSRADNQWSLGVFRRRMVEFLIYAGQDYSTAYTTAFAFRG